MATSTDGFSQIANIALPGTVGGHGDIVTYDDQTDTIWLAQSPDNNVVVIDPNSNTVKATIPNIGNANGIAIAENHAFVADPTHNTLDIINTHNVNSVDQIDLSGVGTTPDGVIYVPSTHQVAVAMDDQNILAFFDVNTHQLVATTQLPNLLDRSGNSIGSGPDVPTYVASKDLIYQPDNNKVDVIDPHSHQIVRVFDYGDPQSFAFAQPGSDKHTLQPTDSTKPVVYDPYSNHLLVGTTNKEILVVNADTGLVDHTISIPGSVDQATIDVATTLAFFGDKTGTADVVQLGSDTLVGGLPTQSGSHTLTVDTENHNVYTYLGNSSPGAAGGSVSVYQDNNFHQDTSVAHLPHDGLLHA